MKAIEAMQGSSAGGRRLLVKIVSFGWTKRRNKLDKGMTKRIPKSNKLMPMHRPEAYNQSGGGKKKPLTSFRCIRRCNYTMMQLKVMR